MVMVQVQFSARPQTHSAHGALSVLLCVPISLGLSVVIRRGEAASARNKDTALYAQFFCILLATPTLNLAVSFWFALSPLAITLIHILPMQGEVTS
jgi:hypothetical protein